MGRLLTRSSPWKAGTGQAFWVIAALSAFAVFSSWIWFGALVDGGGQDAGRSNAENASATAAALGYTPLVLVHLAVITVLTVIAARWRKDAFSGVLLSLFLVLGASLLGGAASFLLWSPQPFIP